MKKIVTLITLLTILAISPKWCHADCSDRSNRSDVCSNLTPTATSCGFTYVLVGDDFAFTVSPGPNSTACDITFSTPFVNTPVCTVTRELGGPGPSYTPINIGLILRQSDEGSNTYDVICEGTKASQ